MFEIIANKNNKSKEKMSVVANILLEAKEEIDAMACEKDTSISKIVSEMIYHCLNRDQISGLKKV